ncbi:MAG: cell division ATP-binding protein FtsE [bacterium]|jgi:cell division transport system ATP-binding protein
MVGLNKVSVVFANHMVALTSVSLTIEKGEFVFLVGSTGAGKSTLIKLLTCEVQPREGSICVNGHDYTSMNARRIPYLRREMGIIPQDNALLPNKRVWENIAYALRVIGIPAKEVRPRVDEVLERVGLTRKANAYPNELSGGEIQRVAIARAIANNPVLLLADEPTGHLDPDTSWDIMQILNQINIRGTTIVVATHDSLMVDRMLKRVIELDHGIVTRDEQKSSYAYDCR